MNTEKKRNEHGSYAVKIKRPMMPNLLSVLFLLCLGIVSSYGKAIYVSTTGSDATSYGANDITHPWLTVDKMFKNTLSGDTAFFYGGNYNITSSINLYSVGNDGTYSSPITVMPKPGESAVTWTAVPASLYKVVQMERIHWHIKKINFVDGYNFFYLGENSAGGGRGFQLDSITWLDSYGDDNQCLVYGNPGSDSMIVQNSTFTGPGNIADPRSTAITMFQTKKFIIRNNVVKNMKIGIFHKHGNTEANGATRANTDIQIYGNIVTGYLSVGINCSSRWAVIRNNIVGPGYDGTSNSLRIGEDGGYVGGDSNSISHNTFIQSVELWYDTRAGDLIPGSIGNIFKDNIVVDYFAVHQYSPVPHYTTLDYNLYKTGSSSILSNSTSYSLASWKIGYGQDANSIAQAPTFTGTPGTVISDYKLQSSSYGHLSASDGRDMGANPDSVGIGAGPGGGGGSCVND